MLCWCSSCFVGAVLALLVQFLLGWCSSCLVGAVLAWLVHLRQVHPLRGCVGMAGMPYPPTIAQTGRVS